MITLAVFVLTVFHPGYCFPVIGAKQAQKYASINRKSLDEEDATVEMLPPQRNTTPDPYTGPVRFAEPVPYNEPPQYAEPVPYADRGI